MSCEDVIGSLEMREFPMHEYGTVVNRDDGNTMQHGSSHRRRGMFTLVIEDEFK